MTTRKEYIEKVSIKLKNLDTALTKLESQAAAAAGELRREIEKEIKEIKQSRSTLEGNIDELRAAGDDAWEDIKTGADLAWQSISISVQNARHRLR